MGKGREGKKRNWNEKNCQRRDWYQDFLIGRFSPFEKRRPFLLGVFWNEKWSFPLFFNWQNLIYTFTEIEIQIMDEDFVIPLCKDDLLNSEEGSYVVDEVLSVRVLPNKLRGRFYCSWRNICRFFTLFCLRCHVDQLSECLSDLRSGVPTAIVQNFDCLFSLLR